MFASRWWPISIGFVAGLLLLFACFAPGFPEPEPTPIDLQQGSTETLVFPANTQGSYIARIEMDLGEAKRLFPCVVDFEVWTAKACEQQDMPLEMSVVLLADGTEVSRQTYSAMGVQGGSYGGDQSYAQEIGRWDLSAQSRYQLVVVSERDASVLASARPRLVAAIEPTASLSRLMDRLLIAAAGAALALIALLWTAALWATRNRRADRRTGD